MAKRYYWLKLKDSFFEDEDIKLLEDMDNGKDYIIFLLKLRLRAINTDGYLNYKGIMPYNEKMLATITNTNIDIVRSALKAFESLGLTHKMDDGTIYLEHVQEIIGSESESTERVRKHRERKELTNKALPRNGHVTKSNTDIDIDIEKDTDKEKQCDAVWEYYKKWMVHLGKKRKKTDSKMKHIRARLEDGFTVEQLQQVLDHALTDKYMLEHSYIEIDNIMRNTEKVEKRLNRAEADKHNRSKVLSIDTS